MLKKTKFDPRKMMEKIVASLSRQLKKDYGTGFNKERAGQVSQMGQLQT